MFINNLAGNIGLPTKYSSSVWLFPKRGEPSVIPSELNILYTCIPNRNVSLSSLKGNVYPRFKFATPKPFNFIVFASFEYLSPL